MSDPQDPFADRPYVPPAQRQDEEPTSRVERDQPPAGPDDTTAFERPRAHETEADLVCRLLLEKKKKQSQG